MKSSASNVVGRHWIMQERPFISSYTVIEKTTDRLAFDVTMDLKPLIKRILISFGVIEGILISVFMLLLLTGVLARDPFVLIFMLLFIIIFGALSIFIHMFSNSVTSIVLDKNSGTCSISAQIIKAHSRGLKMQYSYPLDSLKSLEMINANELEGPGMLRKLYKGMYLLRFKLYSPVRSPGKSFVQGPVFLYTDAQQDRVQELKAMIEEFLAYSRLPMERSNDEQRVPSTKISAGITCPRCGYRYSGNTKISFCPNCGESLEST